MRKILFLLLLSLFIPSLCYGAMSAAITWEFNSLSSGSMVGGGGFVTSASGTDFSRYASAADIETAYPALGKFSGTDLACADGDVNPSVITSATHNFVATDVGNVIHITSMAGVTAGWYQIVSCAGNAATLDRAIGTDGAKTNGTWYLGGALSLNSTLDDEFFDQLVAGQKVYFLSGSYTLGEAVSAAGSGGDTTYIRIIGYTGTRDTACNGLDRPSIACGANVFTCGTKWTIGNISFTGTGAQIFSTPFNVCDYIYNCKFLNSSNTVNRCGLYLYYYVTAFNCESISINGYGFDMGGSYSYLYSSYAHHSNYGIGSSGNGSRAFTVINNISANNKTGALAHCATGADTRNSSFLNNILYGTEYKLGTGIFMPTDNAYDIIINNIIYGFVTGISHGTANSINYIDYNNLYNNTTPTSNVTELGNDISVDPGFTNAAGTLIEDCEDVWVIGCDADENTISVEGTIKKVGTYSVKNAVQAAADAGDIIATEVLTSTNMTAYDGFGVWMYSSVALAAGDWQLLFDDTEGCTSPILTYNIPAMSATTWYWFYFEGGTSLASATAIVSVGLKQVNDKGAMNFYIDDVRGCDNDFTFSSSAGGGVGTGFPQSIGGSSGLSTNMGVDQTDYPGGYFGSVN